MQSLPAPGAIARIHGLRPAVTTKLARLLDRDDEVVVATTLANLVAQHTKILFDPAEDQACEGLANRATDAVRVALGDTLADLRADQLPGPTQIGQRRLASQAARLVEAFQARGAVIEERKRRASLRARIVAAIAALAETAALDPDVIALAAVRLDRVLASAAPLYAAADLDALMTGARSAVGQAAADALLKTAPERAANRLLERPFPELLGAERSARLAKLGARLAPAVAEDAQYERGEAEARAALQSVAEALVPILQAPFLGPVAESVA
jgi:hypothetical protein